MINFAKLEYDDTLVNETSKIIRAG